MGLRIAWGRSIGWNIENMKVKFKDGTYTWVKPNTGGKKTHAGLDAPPGWEWKKLEITQRIYDGPDCYPWRRTFAIWPVTTINGRRIWLKTVYKRRFWAVWGTTGFHMEPEVEYAELFDVLTNEGND